MAPSSACARAFMISALLVASASGMRPEAKFQELQEAPKIHLRQPARSACPDLGAWARRAVEEQLAPWNHTGFTKEMVQQAQDHKPMFRDRSTIWVVKGEVYADYHPWPSYMRTAVENWPFSQEELKSITFMVASETQGDMPTLVRGATDVTAVGPIFVNAKNDNFLDVVMPVAQRPQFLHDWNDKRLETLELAKKVSWKSRKDVAVWRGGASCSIGCGPRGRAYYPDRHAAECKDDLSSMMHCTDECREDLNKFHTNEIGFSYGCADSKEGTGIWARHPRIKLVQKSVERGEECGLDARFTSLNGHTNWMSPTIENTTALLGEFVGDEESAQHRFVINVGGNGYADRTWRMFALGSTVLQVEEGWKEWFTDLLQPYVHYIPIKADGSDVCEQLAWARANEKEAEAIAQRGLAFVETCLNQGLVDLYVAEMMRQLGRLFSKGYGETPFSPGGDMAFFSAGHGGEKPFDVAP